MERGASRTVTYVGFLLAVILVLGSAFVAYRNQKLYQQTVAVEAQTYIVLETATEFLNRMLQGESSARGYVLTGDRALRLDSENSLARTRPLLDSLLSMTRDDPMQRQRLIRIVCLFLGDALDRLDRRHLQRHARNFHLGRNHPTAVADRALRGCGPRKPQRGDKCGEQ